MSSQTKRRFLWVCAFGVSMGFLEAAVVVYLRKIAYPDGFSFPLRTLETRVALVELAREFASLVMIVSVAVIAGRRFREKLAYFLCIFGVWDIFYYVFLKLALGWPGSVLETDILFLIPVPWVGPVLAPVLVSVVMISAGVVIIWLEERRTPIEASWRNIGAEAFCGLVIIASFCLDWRNVLTGKLPRPFAWWMFLLGLVPGTGLFVYEVLRALGAGRARATEGGEDGDTGRPGG